jgi:hypothetical protein
VSGFVSDATAVRLRAIKRRGYRMTADLYRVPEPVGGVQTGIPVRIKSGVRCNIFPGGNAAGGSVGLGLGDADVYSAFVDYDVLPEPGDELRPRSGIYRGYVFNVQGAARHEHENVAQCVKEES